MNLLLDTNVIIDYLGRKPPFFANAERIVAAGYFGDARLWASAQSFKDAFYELSHYVPSDRVQDAILALAEVVEPVDITGEDVLRAARLKWPDMEDCLVSISAQKAGAEYLVTRDEKGFDRSMVTPINPADLLAKIRDEHGVAYDAIEL